MPGVGAASPSKIVTLLLVLVPVAFHAVLLLPEVTTPVPQLNDDAHHFLFIQRANEALGDGENVFDHWLPEVELGFPFFYYYQHLPHLAVVALHRLTLGGVSLLTLYNLTRYLLLVTLPLTVYWSLRRLGFSTVAAATAALACAFPSASHGYGLEYGSYLWRGHGMFTQLWAVHIFFAALACLSRLIERGRGHASTALVLSALALVHLFYGYALVPAALILGAIGIDRANAGARLFRLAVVGAVSAVVSAYLWLPFAAATAYLNASPNLPRWRYDSFGAASVLTWLVDGDLLDRGRWPILTVLLALGVGAAVTAWTRPARLALALFATMLALFFGPATWGRLMDVLPMHEGLPFHRFVGPLHIAALLLIGLGGEWLWRALGPLPERWRAAAVLALLLALIAPVLGERRAFYADNAAMLQGVRTALDGDDDARTILAALVGRPPGRTYAGLRENWGRELRFGHASFYNLLTFRRVVALSPPYASHSLGSDLIWLFDERRPDHFELFDVRSVIAPSRLAPPAFWRPIVVTGRYVLYGVDTGGYGRFVSIAETKTVASLRSLNAELRDWFGAGLAGGRFVRYDYPAGALAGAPPPASGCAAGGGRVDEERVLPGRLDLRVDCPQPASVMLAVSYHPNWRVSVDGQPARPFMLSPGYVGFEVPAGSHRVTAEYRSPAYKTALLALGALTVVAVIVLRRRFGPLEAIVTSRR